MAFFAFDQRSRWGQSFCWCRCAPLLEAVRTARKHSAGLTVDLSDGDSPRPTLSSRRSFTMPGDAASRKHLPVAGPGVLAPGRGDDSLSISIIIPSYRRADALTACLSALSRQTRQPAEVIVVARYGDSDTLAICAGATRITSLRTVLVRRPGMIAALNAGVDAAGGDVIAITDDDCCPEEDWLERIGAEFSAERSVGAVGGPDLIEGARETPARAGQVGRISWYGRISGNHHAGARREDVNFLKGANMAFRSDALAGFDERLRGSGAQIGNDMQASLSVWRRGYRVIYNPAVRVRHYPAKRSDGDPRLNRSLELLREQHHNEMYVIASTLPPWRAIVVGVYTLLVGYRSAPGLAHLALRLFTGPRRLRGLAEFASVTLGRAEGLRTWTVTTQAKFHARATGA